MRCQDCQSRMVEALYDELPAEVREAFDEHVAGCDECADAMAGMKGTLQVMDQFERRDPGPAYWDSYWDRLSARMENEGIAGDRTSMSWWRRRVPGQAWAYRAAAAAAILVLGVFVGRTFFPAPMPGQNLATDTTATRSVASNGPDGGVTTPRESVAELDDIATEPTGNPDVASTDTPTPQVGTQPGQTDRGSEPAVEKTTGGDIQAASADDRAMRYIAKSQLLLIALVNNDPNEPDAYASGISDQRRRSRELLAEAPDIRAELDSPKQRRLRELVADLEKILIQIANLESDEDMDGVEFIRSRVNDHDVLFKIDLEQMRHGVDGSASGSAQERSYD